MDEIASVVADAKRANATLRVGIEAKRLDDTYPASGFSRGRIINELILAASSVGMSMGATAMGEGEGTSRADRLEIVPAKLVARCPVTGGDVFPSAAEAASATGSIVITCPSCGGQHRWVPETGHLFDVSNAEGRADAGRRGTATAGLGEEEASNATDEFELDQTDGLESGNYAEMEWQPISTAPFDRDLELAVIEGGEPHALVFPCRRILGGWLNAQTQRRVEVLPTHWREWDERNSILASVLRP